MPSSQELSLRQEVSKSLERMQQFDPETLSREQDLGSELHC